MRGREQKSIHVNMVNLCELKILNCILGLVPPNTIVISLNNSKQNIAFLLPDFPSMLKHTEGLNEEQHDLKGKIPQRHLLTLEVTIKQTRGLDWIRTAALSTEQTKLKLKT